MSWLLESLDKQANLIPKCERLGLPAPGKKEVHKVLEDVKDILADTRGMKSDYWQECASRYKDAIKLIKEELEKFPSGAEITEASRKHVDRRWKIFGVIMTAVAAVAALVALFK